MSELTDEQRKLIDELAHSVSKLCHAVIAKRLGQFFEVIGAEVSASAGINARLMDALNREPGESLVEWEARVHRVRNSIRKPALRARKQQNHETNNT